MLDFGAAVFVTLTAAPKQSIVRLSKLAARLSLAGRTAQPATPHGWRHTPHLPGSASNGGVQDLFQHFTRPSLNLTPYRTPAKD